MIMTEASYGGEVSRSRIIQGEADRPTPPGVNIEFGQLRADRQQRLRYEEHLNMCFANETLSDNEHEARLEAARHATTVADLKLLTLDLPALAPTKEQAAKIAADEKAKARRNNWLHRTYASANGRMGLFLGGVGLSLGLMIFSIVALSVPKHILLWPAPLLGIGLVGFVSFIIMAGVMSNHVKWKGQKGLSWKHDYE